MNFSSCKAKIITKPTLALFRRFIKRFNENLESGAFPYLARNEKIDLKEAEVWMEKYRKGRQLVSLAIVGNEVIGAGVIKVLHGKKDHNGVIFVSVDRYHRGRGIGEVLFRSLIEQAKNRGLKRIESEPAVENVEAIELEKKLHFKKEEGS